MKYSLFFIAFVVMAAVNVSALPADATNLTSLTKVNDLYAPEKPAPGGPRAEAPTATPGLSPGRVHK
ncbi:hypothetical protein MVLG_04096 [Microbotryum lychnidis-dioicae p1A1 Lamole]|uniref:Uncharacterized protein n=2 Tax=Microbotryum TaxID=34416 RepID=U5HA61_USTV1|nr:hypothetical protein MVLG_04096 [Microbotryum lychnidis-dioicae p1A1 Lamole]SGZ27536.1 BQ5605_C026g10116 [Microbotryum silenes-dioicae]|eukprot:KDE05502.1 hypothetical protein MVLG_04096 [Microbotryum lychnidis-dioicae p1A1 Lamole]